MLAEVVIAEGEPFDIVFSYCTGVLPACLAVPAGCHVIDFVDADSRKWFDYAERARWPMSAVYRAEGRAVARLERRAVERCQAAFITSAAEAELLPKGPATVLPVGIGVDSKYFSPGAVAPQPGQPRAAVCSLVFTGWMNYKPNIDAACWFVREVLPTLRQRLGKVSLAIVGGSPAPRVQELAAVEGVTVTGYVPDVRPYVAAADVAVVPLRIARGVQNKVAEALAMGKPVVASPGALTGLDVQPGRDALLADTPDQWVECILSLVGPDGPKPAAAELGRRARQAAVKRFNWSAVLRPMVETCAALAERIM